MDQPISACRLAVFAICLVAVTSAFGNETEPAANGLTAGHPPAILASPGSGACPESGSLLSAVELQQRMTAVVTYLQGGPDPTTAFACGEPDRRSIEGLSILQALIRDGVCSLTAAPPAQVCGLKSGLHKLSCRSLTAAEFSAIKSIPGNIDRCWQLGASGFFIVGGAESSARDDGTYDLSFAIDPEPAHLTQTLSGTQGATAAAYYVNSGTPTSVVKWPGTWTANTTLTAGTPCSTVSLAAGAETTMTIQANGNYRKCMEANTPPPPAESDEPVRLTEALSGAPGATAAGYYVNSRATTSVVKWVGTWTTNTTLGAGKPCSTLDLASGAETTMTIQASGNYRKCM